MLPFYTDGVRSDSPIASKKRKVKVNKDVKIHPKGITIINLEPEDTLKGDKLHASHKPVQKSEIPQNQLSDDIKSASSKEKGHTSQPCGLDEKADSIKGMKNVLHCFH